MPFERGRSRPTLSRCGAVPLGLAFFLSACGGETPASPSPLQLLVPGRYEVVFTAGPGAAGGTSFCSLLSSGSSTPPDTSATFMATGALDVAGRLTLRPEAAFDLGWTMMVQQTEAEVSGTMQGAARDMRYDTTTVTIDGGSPQTPARLTGRPGSSALAVGGPIDGRAIFSAGGVSYGCSGSEWRITRRP